MKPTIEIFTKLQENSAKNHDEIFTKLFRYILRPDIYYVAYSTRVRITTLPTARCATTSAAMAVCTNTKGGIL